MHVGALTTLPVLSSDLIGHLCRHLICHRRPIRELMSRHIKIQSYHSDDNLIFIPMIK
jgi:hypothetical protein